MMILLRKILVLVLWHSRWVVSIQVGVVGYGKKVAFVQIKLVVTNKASLISNDSMVILENSSELGGSDLRHEDILVQQFM